MQPTLIIVAVACFSAKTFAQTAQDPDLSSDLANLPSSVASQVSLAATKLDGDILEYASTLVDGAPFATAASRLEPILPDDAKSQIASDPAGFIFNLITEPTAPFWADAVPTDVIPYFRSVDEDVNSIIKNDQTLPPLPRPTRTTNLGPRPGSSGTTTVPITRPTVAATSLASTVATAPAGSGVLPSRGIGTGTVSVNGSVTGGVVTPITPSTPSSTSVSQFVSSSASRWNSMTGAVAALMAVGVGAILLA